MELEPWLILLLASPPPASKLLALLRESPDPAALLSKSPAQLQAAGLSPETCRRIKDPDTLKLKQLSSWLAGLDNSLVPVGSEGYPPVLATLPDAPVALWVRGDPRVLGEPQLAMVGSRNPTRGGLSNARSFARTLAEAGLTITSGMALGIDGASHAGALESGAPTVAVLGCGPDKIYPTQHKALAEHIASQGALVSEYLPGTEAARHHFPCRNRIIAGLALGTLVIEASRRSGSLITARLAGEYGREVFAIPGSIHNPMARGCHQLIRQGAKLVEDTADVLKELALELADYLGPSDVPTRTPVAALEADQGLDASYRNVLECMGFDPVGLADLTKRTGLTAAELSSMLLVLELESFVEALPGGRYSRIEKRDA
jgi:DNA processing protein